MQVPLTTLALWIPGPLELVIIGVLGLMGLASLAGIVILVFLAIRGTNQSR